MAELRFSALREVFSREPVEVTTPSKIVSEYYGENVFDLPKMEHYLSKEAYKVVKRAINEGKSLNPSGGRSWLQQGLKHGRSAKGPLIILTGFILLQTELQKNMTVSLKLVIMDMLLRNFQVKFWSSQNLMHPVSRAEVSGIHLKQEDILHGMFHHLYLL